MIDLARIVGFDWDEGNARKSAEKHTVSQEEAEQVFANMPLAILEDVVHGHTEQRYHALGTTDEGRYLHVTFTLRDKNTKIRVISARSMSRKEKAAYEKEA